MVDVGACPHIMLNREVGRAKTAKSAKGSAACSKVHPHAMVTKAAKIPEARHEALTESPDKGEI
jgi:type II secretory pathway component PulC